MLTPVTFLRWLRQWRRTNLKVERIEVLEHVDDAGALGPRYAFMTVMSCGIATLGLLQNSAAVIIGAMLISPLMGPIVEMGMSLATFDYRTLRASLMTLVVGVALSLVTAVLIVAVSPIQDPTAEILARTQPTLFDLMVAIFSGLAGAYATITRKGETIVGVAIATALMPPLAVLGFGIATGNAHIAGGAGFLFMTNLLAIALSVTAMARWYGFGRGDTPQQTAVQAALIIGVFVVLSIPLGIALRNIAARGLAEATVRSTLDEAAEQASGRITTLRVDASTNPVLVDAVLLTPHHVVALPAALEKSLQRKLGRKVDVQIREVLTSDEAELAREKSTMFELRRSIEALQSAAQKEQEKESDRVIAEAARWAARERVLGGLGTFETNREGVTTRLLLAPDSGLSLTAARRLENGSASDGSDPTLEVVPPLQALPVVSFADDSAELGTRALARARNAAWALRRWRAPAVRVIGYAGGDPELARARGEALADALRTEKAAVASVDVASQADFRTLAAREGVDAARSARIELAPLR